MDGLETIHIYMYRCRSRYSLWLSDLHSGGDNGLQNVHTMSASDDSRRVFALANGSMKYETGLQYIYIDILQNSSSSGLNFHSYTIDT